MNIDLQPYAAALSKVVELFEFINAVQSAEIPDHPDRLETILWLDLPMADAIDPPKANAALNKVCSDYCNTYGLTMTGTPMVTHADQFGPMDNVQVRHRIRMYAEPLASAIANAETALDADLDGVPVYVEGE